MKREMIEVLLISLEVRLRDATYMSKYNDSLKSEVALLGGQVVALHEELRKLIVEAADSKPVGTIPLDHKGDPLITTEMKGVCIGEFSWTEDAPYYDELGELHDHERTNEVPWDLCKKIYKAMAKIAMEGSKK